MEIYKQEFGYRNIHIGELFVITGQTKENYILKVYPCGTAVEKIERGELKGRRIQLSKEKAKANLTMYAYGIYRKGQSPNSRPIFSMTLAFNELMKEMLTVEDEMNEHDEVWIYKKFSSENGRIGVQSFIKENGTLKQIDLLRVDNLKGEL